MVATSNASLSLRPLSLSDKNKIHKWLADPYILSLTFVVPGPGHHAVLPFSYAAAERYFNMLLTDPTRMTFAIESYGNHIGTIGLKEYYPECKHSECFIEIGESEYRGKGIGTWAMSMILDHAFDNICLNEIRLEVLEFNYPAIRTYEKLGFMHIRRSGWHYDKNQRYWQVFAMSITAERWQKCKKFVPMIPTPSWQTVL